MKKITYLILLLASLSGWNASAQCLEGYQWPEEAITPATCDGVTENEAAGDGYAGEYSAIVVTQGETYVFKSSIGTDFITISTDEGVTAATSGITPLTWVADVSGEVWFYTHDDDQCGDSSVERVRSVICGTPSADSPDYANLQWPPNATIAQGAAVTVYAQVYEGGLTDVEPGLGGQAAGIQAWVGVNPSNTDPATWPASAWTVASHNSASVGNNDEYMAEIGADLFGGTYYYATRFRLNTGGYVYGGIDSNNNGNFWNGTTHNSGVLTVTPTLANDFCSGAIALTVGATYEANPITASNLATAANDGFLPECQESAGENVWFTVTVPASGDLTLELRAIDGSTFEDSVLSVYTGTCGSLVELDCNDDFGTSLMSKLELTELTPAEVLYVSVWRYNGGFQDDGPGDFEISSYDVNLSAGDIATGKLSAFPNPVKDVLTLSSPNHAITDVKVFNILGQQVMAKSGASVSDINMASLSAGSYIVKITANNEVKTIKVLKS